MVSTESSNLSFKSPQGVQLIAIIIEHRGGVNNYGWWIVEAEGTGEIFDVWIGRDVNDSKLVEGGTILERFDKEIHTEEDVKRRVNELMNLKKS